MSSVSDSQTAGRNARVAGPRPTLGQFLCELRDVAVAVPLFAASPLVRHWHRRWGATDAEVATAMPGDELVPGCQYRCTRAITIDAPPEAVWPWLVQVGFGKAGFYSNDLLDNVARPSADRILDEFQDPKAGDWVPMFSKVNDTTAFKIASIKPARARVGQAGQHLGMDVERGRWPHPTGYAATNSVPVASSCRCADVACAQRVRRFPDDAQDAPEAEAACGGGAARDRPRGHHMSRSAAVSERRAERTGARRRSSSSRRLRDIVQAGVMLGGIRARAEVTQGLGSTRPLGRSLRAA